MKKIVVSGCLWLLCLNGLVAASLRLVVIGDTQPTFVGNSFAIFEREIGQINALKPDAVVNLGDQIRGYGLSDTNKEWDHYAQLAARIESPYFRIPGNHDIFSRNSQEIYLKRFGRAYYSLDFHGYHLVMLDDLQDRTWGKIGTAEFAWLKNDLEAQREKHILVFVHIPVWYPNARHVDRVWREFWLEEVHPLLVKHGVIAVFAGHFHRFGPTITADGVAYYISGGGGGQLAKVYSQHGGSHHFLLVQTADNRLHVQVIAPGEVLEAEAADVVKNAHFAEANTSQAYIDFEKIKHQSRHRFSISLANPYGQDLTGNARWEFSTKSFRFTPETIAIHIPARQRAVYDFEFKVLDNNFDLLDLPRLHFKLRAGGEKHDFLREIVFKRHIKVSRATKGIVCDGNLADWAGIAPLRLFNPGKPDPVAEIMLSYRQDFFYIGVIVHELAGTDVDSDTLPFLNDSLVIGIDRLRQRDRSENDLELEFFRTGGRTRIYDRVSGKEIDSARWKIVSRMVRKEHEVVYEIALPASFMLPVVLKSGQRFGLSIAINDIEADGRPLIALTPGIGDASGQIHFAEIRLGK